MSQIQFFFLHRIEIAKEEGAYILLINCPSCILSLEQGLELMQESCEPTEFGIFDFYKVFSRASGEEDNGAAGT
jgi:Fe-S oxidoreductase